MLTIRAIALAKPTFMIRLSLTGETWPEVKRNTQQFNRAMHKALGHDGWAACYQVHQNPSGDGQTHVHMYARADRLDADLVQEKAIKVGMGREVHVQSIQEVGLGYGMHPVADTSDLDHDEAAAEVKDFIDINGGTYVHGTRGFWRDRSGNPTTLKAARRSSANPDDWTVQYLPKTDS